MSDPESTPSNRDAEVLLETLVREGIVRIDERPDRADGTTETAEADGIEAIGETGETDGSEVVTTTTDFEDAYEVYLDTYRSVPEAEFVAAVGEVFELGTADRAARQVEEAGVTREQFAAHLALDAFLDESYSTEELSRMAVVASALETATPIPDGIDALDDGSYEAFVAESDRAIITVWKRRCDPCRAMKNELDDVLEAMPEDAPVGGIDGEENPTFRREFGVDSAPALLLFENGRLAEGFTGRATPERVATACADVYDS